MNARTETPWTETVPDAASALRVPPHSVEAEQSVLGGLLLDCAAWDRAADLLTEADFYRHEHRLIWSAIGVLVCSNKPADAITVFEQLRSMGKAQDVGGLEYLTALSQSVLGVSNLRRYAEIVRERSVLRQLISIADNAAASAFHTNGRSLAEIVEQTSSALAGLERQQLRNVPTPLIDVITRQIDHYSALAAGDVQPGMPTGFRAIDEMLSGGLRPGLYIVAARPSVGKSSFTAQIALTLALRGESTLFLSQEMSERQVADRAMANVARVSLTGLITGHIDDSDWGRIADAADTLRAAPFHIDGQPALRLAEIRAKARSIKGLRCLVLDYLQLCSSDLRGENRNNQIEEISRGLKALSKQLDIPVIALSQLSRKVEERATKRPNLGDLRDSGAIEQDADVVMFLWPVREFKESNRKIVGLSIDKNRDGATSEHALEFYGPHQRWAESTADLSPPGRAVGRTAGFE